MRPSRIASRPVIGVDAEEQLSTMCAKAAVERFSGPLLRRLWCCSAPFLLSTELFSAAPG